MDFRKDLTLIICLTSLSTYAAPLPQTGSGETDGYKIVWQDLFDGPQLNPECWNIEINGGGGGNNELQYYTDSENNVRIGDDGDGNSCLILTACREDYKGKSFTSGRINSKNLTTFTHGKLEASIKLPSTANGLWPAFWMMGNDYDKVGWPRCGETDILEMGNAEGIKNGTQDRFYNGACHWGEGWPACSYAQSRTRSYSLQDGEYHLFTLIWTPEKISMYCDIDKNPEQLPYYSMDVLCNEPDNKFSPGNYFHKPNFILFNLAVGGDFTGIHNPADITALNDENHQKASMYVNYVKIYQKAGEDNTLDYVTDPNPAGSGVEQIVIPGEANGTSADTVYYNLQGVRIAAPTAPGIYIIENAGKTSKILLK